MAAARAVGMTHEPIAFESITDDQLTGVTGGSLSSMIGGLSGLFSKGKQIIGIAKEAIDLFSGGSRKGGQGQAPADASGGDPGAEG
jgi:hypothetical protein